MEEEDLVRMRNTDLHSSCSSNPSTSLPTSPFPQSKSYEYHEQSNGITGGAALLALMLGLLPSALNAVFGSSQAWTELCVFIIVSIWIYYSLRVPWDLFLAASAEEQMSVRERFYLFMVFIAPLSSAFGLWTLKSYFAEGLVFSKFHIPLFLIGAFLRPVMHLLSSVESAGPSEPTDKLIRRIEALEHEISLMRSADATNDSEAPLSPTVDLMLQKKLLQLDKRMQGVESVVRKRLNSPSERPQSFVLRLVYPIILLFGWPIFAIKKLFIG